ncbi:MAG TPA: hypothetical protein ACFYD6_10635 [Candidatus Brocadiia bacterium]|nr:hypothetical protein [Planctomycetota bacterium]MDO8093238.1 hypothetical protein [Candidatus Brocadiales bacterium]
MLEETEPGSGVIIFDRKIDGVLSKFYTGLFSIILLPPLLLFAAALAIGVALLIFPLASIALLSTFPVILFSLVILGIALPVGGPIIIIYLLITEKGKLSIWPSNGIIRLRFFKRKQ